jgi:uncharacterized protein
MDDLIERLATAGNVLPEEAMRAALSDWGAAAPRLLALLEAYAAGEDRSERAETAVFFILFLAAERRESRAFAPICRLARDAEAMEAALGDGITESFADILADTFDGSVETLLGVVDDAETDGSVRDAALGALTLLTAQGRIAREAAEAALGALHDRWTAQGETDELLWVGWQQAVALLGLDGLRPRAVALFRRRLIPRSFMELRDFEEDLRAGLAAETVEARLALLERHHLSSVRDAIGLLSGWHAFSERYRQELAERERRDAERLVAAALRGPGDVARDFVFPTPAILDPHRGVGRNDPCPCGSGKKFKKCCLAA